MIEPETASRIPNLRLVGVYAAGAGLWNVIADQLPALLSLDPAGSALVGTLKGWGLVAVTSLLLGLLLKPAPRRQVPATAPTIASAAPCRPGLRWVHCLAPSLFVVLIGVSVYAVVANSIRQTENERLGAIAAFKKDQIESWLAERRGDILVAGNGPFFIDALAKYLARPDETLRSQLALRMDVSMKAYGYAGAKVLGLDGRVIVRTGDADQDDRDLQAAARQALGQSEPVLLDLHRAAPAEPIRLALVTPIRDARLPERPAIGVVALSIDPTRNLFPMLGSWPTATSSGETLIVRRDGNDALFLSPLRHRTDAPMTLRIPLSRMDVPAVQGLTLGAGIYHGVDYREQSVLTAIRPIAGTPWMLVAKVDQQEVYSGVRTAAGVCAALVLAGLTVIGLFLVMAWRQQRLRDLLVQGELGDRLAKVATSVPGLIYSFRLHPDGRTSMPIAGPALSDLCGLAPDDVAEDAGPIFSRMPPEDAERVMVSVTESARTLTPWRDDFRFRHPNKGERRIEGNAVPKREPDGSILWHGYLHDVTGRKQTEVALAKANRLLRTRSASTVALLNANDERSYLETVCQNVVAICGHTMVWVGYAEPDGARRVLPMATAGLDHGYLERAAITWADDEHGCGPTGTAIRTREAVVCQDMDGDNRLKPWRDDALQRGYHSSIALPLIAGAEVLGALTIYSAERAAFPDEDIDLLREVATDVADGISTLRLRIAHNRIERALRESEMKLRLFIEHAPAALAMFDTAMRYLFASRRWLSDYHLDLQDIVGKSHYEVFPEIPERWKEIHRRCLAGASETCDEDAFHRLDGRTDWLRWAIHPWYKDSGELGGIVTMSEHITEQVETRQALRKLSLAVDQSPTSIIITDLDHRIDYVNEAFTRITGYSREETLGRNPNFRASGRTPTETYRQLASALKQGEPWRGEFHNRRKTGEDCLELALVSPIRQHDGAITSYLSIQEDITEKRRIEEELTRHQLHLEELVSERTCQLQKSSRLAEERADEIADLYNHAPCGYHSLDPFGRFQKINDTELTWLGYTRDEVIGRMGFSDLLSADQNLRFQANLSQLITQGYLKDMDYELRRKDGRTIPVLVSATALRDQSGIFLMSRSVVYNLTEIKEAERAASRHAQLAEAFFRHSVACLVILDRDYHVLRVNNAYARACRRHVEDFVGCEYFALYPSESKVIFDEVVRTKRPFAAFNSAFAFADQPERGVTYWDWTLVPILGQDGEIEYLVFSLNDVTERKRAEEALRESERFIRTIAGNLPGMVGYWDTDLRCRFANHHYLEWFGKTSEQMIGITIQELMGETLFAQNEPFIRGVLRGEEQTFERTLIKQNGDPGFTLARYIPDRNEQGLVTGFFVLVTDITAIKHSEQRLMEITAALGEGLQMIDERGHVVFSNPAASRLLGWSEAEMLGAPGHQLMHAHRPDGSPYLREDSPLYQAFMSEGTLIDHEDVFWTKDGRLLPVSVTLTTIRRHRHKAGAVVAFQDITRRKQAEAELQRYRDSLETMVQERTAALSESNEQLAIAKDLAETANRAKSTFLSNMSHELRTPLSAILGFAQLLEMAPDGRSDRDELCISHIISSGKHLLALINDILDLSKIDAGHLTVTSERVVTSKIIRNLHGALLPLAATVGVPVRVHLIEDLPDAWADLTRLNQVLLNLGSNAIKYNRPGGRVDIIAELPNPDFLRLTVADTGPGIPVERQKDLFKPFNRLGREAGPIEGTGIGLVLSRRLVRLMGGSMGFTSVPDEGSRFWIDIPVYAPEREANGEDAGSAQAREEKKRKIIDDGPRTILCVDDNVTGLELVAKIFARIPGTHLLTAGTAEAGIELAKRHHPDIILMDIMLPAMDGISALTELRRHPETKDIPVFALSAAATPSDMDKGLTAGFVRYLTKPYDVHELVTAVIDTLNKTSRGP